MAWSYSYQNEHCEILSKLMENPIGYIHYSACGILYNADLPPPPCKLTSKEPKVIIVNIYAYIIVNIYDNPSGT